MNSGNSKQVFCSVAVLWFCCLVIGTTLPASTLASSTSQVLRSTTEIEAATDALWSAMRNNDTAAAQSAIDRGADLKKKVLGWNPLHRAAFYGHVEMIDVLCRAGADLEAPNAVGYKPLQMAAMYGHDSAVSHLIKAGANIHALGGGLTPLETAILSKHNSTGYLLRSLGALA